MLYHQDFSKIPSRSITVQHLVSRLLALTLACRLLDLDSLLLLRYCSITTKSHFQLVQFILFLCHISFADLRSGAVFPP